MARRFSPFLRIILLALVAVAAVAASSPWWLPALGSALQENDGPAKADIGVVLGGDYWGERIEKAAELIRAGYIPRALISGPTGFYGMHECDLAIPFIVRQGYPAADFIPFPHDAHSTIDEARVVLSEMRRRNIHTLLLITSNYHSHRAARTFRYVGRSMGYLPAMRVVAAPDEVFRPGDWWKTREGRKVVALEWSKTLAFDVGM